MLALPSRRQHLPLHHHTPTTSLPSATQPIYPQLSQQYPVQPAFDQKFLSDYLESQQQPADSFMTAAYPVYANPAIRVQQSTPTPQSRQNGFQQTPMLSASSNNGGLESWQTYGSMPSQSLQTPTQNNNSEGHQRASSSSSVGSSTSHYQSIGPSKSYQYVADMDALRLHGVADHDPRTFSNTLPTPTQTPTQDSFMNSNNFSNYTSTAGNMEQTMSAHMSMKQALMDHSDDVPDFAHSARQSVSSYGRDSPATPRAVPDDLDYKSPANGEAFRETVQWLFNKLDAYYNDLESRPVPKFERTYTDIAADTFYDASAVAAPPPKKPKPTQPSLLSPYRSSNTDSIQRALQAAQYARSHSPTSSASRSDSPFRRGSPYRQPSNSINSQVVGSAAAAREHTRQADAAHAMKSQMRGHDDVEVKTISPKDALLDYRETEEDSKAPLFSDSGANDYDGQYRNATQPAFDTASSQSYQRENWQTSQFPPNFSSITAPSAFNVVTPSSVHSLSTLPLVVNSQYRSTPSSMSSGVDQTPEFPAHLTSMESSASEAEPPSGSQNSVLSDRFLAKPTSTGADTGTYSCTYHGCSQRFETPQKLQKHKREGHRNVNLSNTITSVDISEQNSQAGPHKCERTNPTTGKPCNTIFSRPYDLTRHEDTIHNGRKQKVRCALCIEEKTFSRNDALTRHMRVVHPEVDFPGKHRRRGGAHD